MKWLFSQREDSPHYYAFLFLTTLNNSHMHHNDFTAVMGSHLNKWLGKRCWLPFFIGAAFCWITPFSIPQSSELCFLLTCSVTVFGCVQVSSVEFSITAHVTETERVSRHWNDSIAVVPQYVFSLWWVMAERWSDHVEEQKGKEMTERWMWRFT